MTSFIDEVRSQANLLVLIFFCKKVSEFTISDYFQIKVLKTKNHFMSHVPKNPNKEN